MIGQNSRYLLTDIVQITDSVTGNLVRPAFVDIRQRVTSVSPDDQFIVTSDAMGWAAMALTRLGDARHWWIIADLSGVVDPFDELVPGIQLRAPSIQRFLFNILSPQQTST